MPNMKFPSFILYFMLLYFLLAQFIYSSEPNLSSSFEDLVKTDDNSRITTRSSSSTTVEEEKTDNNDDEGDDDDTDDEGDGDDTDDEGDDDDTDDESGGDVTDGEGDGDNTDDEGVDDDTGDRSQSADTEKYGTRNNENGSDSKESEKGQDQTVQCDEDVSDDIMCIVSSTSSEKNELEQKSDFRYTLSQGFQSQNWLELTLLGTHQKHLHETEEKEAGRSDEMAHAKSFINILKKITLNSMEMKSCYFTNNVCQVLETAQLKFQKHLQDLNVEMMKTVESLKAATIEELKIIDAREHTKLANFAYLVHSINFDRPKSKRFKKILDSVFEHASSIQITKKRLPVPSFDQLPLFVELMEDYLKQTDALLYNLQVFFSCFNCTIYRSLHTPFLATNSVNRNKRMERLIRSLNRLVRMGNGSKVLDNRREYTELLNTIANRLEYFIRIAHLEVTKGKLELAKLLKKTSLKGYDLNFQTLELFFLNLRDSNIQAKQKLISYLYDLQEKGQLSEEHIKLMELLNEDERIIDEKRQKALDLYKMTDAETLQGEASSSEKPQTSSDQRIVNDIAKCFMKFAASERALSVLKPVEQIIRKILEENSTITSGESKKDDDSDGDDGDGDKTISKEKEEKGEVEEKVGVLTTEELQQIKKHIRNMQQNFQHMISIEGFIYSLEKKKMNLNNMQKCIKQSLYFLNLIKKNYKLLDEMKPLNMENDTVVKLIKQILVFMHYAVNTFAS